MTGIRSKCLISVPPEKPKVFDERGQEVRLKLGPYRIGDTVTLKCTAYGGTPQKKLNFSLTRCVNLFSSQSNLIPIFATALDFLNPLTLSSSLLIKEYWTRC